jgi:excisionase family DNA binding protein
MNEQIILHVTRWICGAVDPHEAIATLRTKASEAIGIRDAFVQTGMEAGALATTCGQHAMLASDVDRVRALAAMRDKVRGAESQCRDAVRYHQDILDTLAAIQPDLERVAAQFDALGRPDGYRLWVAAKCRLLHPQGFRVSPRTQPRTRRLFRTASTKWRRRRLRHRRRRIVIRPPAAPMADQKHMEGLIQELRKELAEIGKQPTVSQSPYVTVARAAKLCAVHPSTVRKWVQRGEINRYPPEGRIYRIRRDELEAHLAGAGKPRPDRITDDDIEKRAREILAEDRAG